MKEIFASGNLAGEAKNVFGGYYRSYQSLLRSGAEYSSVNDLLSIEVVVGDEQTCYNLLGLLHSLYSKLVVPNGFRDYLYVPTFDGYSALQTTINFPGYGLVKYVITTKSRSEFNHKGVLATVETPNGERQVYKAKLVRDVDGRMAVLPEKGTVLDAAVALYGNKVALVTGFQVNGVEVDPSDPIDHAGVLSMTMMGRPGWSRFDGVACSSATRHTIDDRMAVEERKIRSNQGKDKMDMYLRAVGFGLLELEDLTFINEKTRGFLDQIIAKVAGSKGTLDDFYFALSREYGAEPDDVVCWLRTFGLSKERLGLSTILLEVKDKPGILYELTELLGQLGGEANINKVVQSEKVGQKGVVVLRFVLTGLTSNQESAVRYSLERKKNVYKMVMV